MAREEDKHRGPEYVPPGPVRIAGNPIAELSRRIATLEAQVKSLQLAMPKGLPKP